MKGKVIYEETQSARRTWSWYMVIVVGLLMIGIFGKGIYSQFVMGEPWGDKPMSDTGLILSFLGTLPFIIIIFVFISIHRLYIQVDEGTLRYKYFPYIRSIRNINRDQLKSMNVRKYNPIFEYGGWGYRFRFKKGRALNIAGNWGLQLVFKDGKKLLIGTQNPIELDKAINVLKENWGMS